MRVLVRVARGLWMFVEDVGRVHRMASCEILADVPRELVPLRKNEDGRLTSRIWIGVEHTFTKLSALISFFSISSCLALDLHVLLSTSSYIRCCSGLVSRRVYLLRRIVTIAFGIIARCLGFLAVFIVVVVGCLGFDAVCFEALNPGDGRSRSID